MEVFGLFCLYGLAAYEDIRTRQIRLLEIVVFGVAGIIMNLVFKPYPVISVLGGVLIGVLMYIFSIISHEKIGKGDALIVMVTGLYLGFMNTVIVVWVSSIMAAIIGGLYLKGKHKRLNLELPFVPFLLSAYCLLYLINCLGGINV